MEYNTPMTIPGNLTQKEAKEILNSIREKEEDVLNWKKYLQALCPHEDKMWYDANTGNSYAHYQCRLCKTKFTYEVVDSEEKLVSSWSSYKGINFL